VDIPVDVVAATAFQEVAGLVAEVILTQIGSSRSETTNEGRSQGEAKQSMSNLQA
jgi:hypothetical protein